MVKKRRQARCCSQLITIPSSDPAERVHYQISSDGSVRLIEHRNPSVTEP